jgi:hypothetical protein
MPSFMDMMTMRAVENIGALLIDPDPYVRLQASLAVLEFSAPRIDEMDEQYDALDEEKDAPEDGADRDDLAELDEFEGEAQVTHMVSPEEVAERLAAAAQVAPPERIPPAAERAGRSAIGSGQQR